MVLKKIKLDHLAKMFYWLALVALLLTAGLLASSALNVPGSIKVFSVQSGSMEPVIKTGSIVLIKPSAAYQKDEIITYNLSESKHFITTHRIVDVSEEKGVATYYTKGDANDGVDPDPVSYNAVLGKVVYSIPLLGYPVAFARTQLGFMLLIIIPSTLIVYTELMNIKREALRLIKKRRTHKLSLAEKVEVAVGQEEIFVEKKLKNLFRKKK